MVLKRWSLSTGTRQRVFGRYTPVVVKKIPRPFTLNCPLSRSFLWPPTYCTRTSGPWTMEKLPQIDYIVGATLILRKAMVRNRFSDDVAFTVENGLHQTGEQFNMKIGFLSRCISVIWKVLGWHYEYCTTFQYWLLSAPLAQWCSLEQVCRPNNNPKQTRASVQESGCDRTDRRFSESAGSTQSSATHRHGEAVGGIFLKYCVAFMKLFCGLGDLNIGLWSDEQVSCKLWYWRDSLESRYTAEWI